MFNSGILDVAIGLIFVFLLVSLLVTIANEMVAAALLSRAKWLQKGITQLLGSAWMKKFYAHPLIQGTTAKGSRGKKAVGPSYIPSRAYATVLLHLVAEQGGAVSTARAALQNTLDQFPTNTGAVASLKDAMRNAVGEGASKKLQAELKVVLDNMPSETGYSVGDAKRDIQIFINGIPDRYMRQTISQIEDRHLKETLMVLLDDAEHNIEKFKENIEVWFNNAMDRVGGWYKRRSQLTTFLMALLLTVALNVDALLIVHHLNTQPGVRDSLVAQAKAFAEHPPASLQNAPSAGGAPSGSKAESAREAEFDSIRSQLNQLSLPIGWFSASDKTNAAQQKFRGDNLLVLPRTSVSSWNPLEWTEWSGWLSNLSFHGVGWLLTALAASLGAPFWFDMLNKVMSIRSAGKAPEEKPKPPKEVPTPLEPGQSPREADRVNAVQRR